MNDCYFLTIADETGAQLFETKAEAKREMKRRARLRPAVAMRVTENGLGGPVVAKHTPRGRSIDTRTYGTPIDITPEMIAAAEREQVEAERLVDAHFARKQRVADKKED